MKNKNKIAPRRAQTRRQEIVIKVQPIPASIPTASDLSEPIHEGKKLTLPKTWLSDKQLIKIVQATPREHVYKRSGKGGQTWDYVTTSYVTKVLNYTFGWNWDFDIAEQGREGDFIWVKGVLTVRGEGPNQVIKKTQFGRAEIKYLRGSNKPLDYGNDLKAAASDALKKCASMLGIASDIYGKFDYKQETDRDVQEDRAQITAPKVAVRPVIKAGQVLGPNGIPTYICSQTDEPISEAEYDYSMKLYGRPLSRAAQKNAKPKK